MASSKQSSLEDRTLAALRALGLTPEDSILAAVSGGIDSMSLLHTFARLRERGETQSLHAIHVNHQLRGEASNADERLVRKTCEALTVDLVVRHSKTAEFAASRKLGLEEAARIERYEAFAETARELRVHFIATAHTANDQAETVLMNLVRGAGLRGISGIPDIRSLGDRTIIRPWLEVSRQQIEHFATQQSIHYSEDATNAELTFQRNRVRHIVLPSLTEAFPDRDVIAALGRTAERMRGLDRFILRLAHEELERARAGEALALERLQSLPAEITAEVFQLWLSQTYGHHRLDAEERERILRLIAEGSGKIQLAHDLVVEIDEGRIRRTGDTEAFPAQALAIGMRCKLPQGVVSAGVATHLTLDAHHLYIDEQRLPMLLIRPWRDRDRISPFGMPGQSKLVSDLLTDSGVTRDARKHYPLIEDTATGAILWVPGVRAAEETRRERSSSVRGLIEILWQPT